MSCDFADFVITKGGRLTYGVVSEFLDDVKTRRSNRDQLCNMCQVSKAV